MRSLFLVLTLFLLGCADPIYPVVPPQPVPPPPVVVVDPPAPVEGSLTYDQVELVRPGMTRAEVVEQLGAPANEFSHVDESFDLAWPAADKAGGARRLEVRFNAGGAVISRALW